MKKILVIGPSWVGDTVMSQTLFKLIKQQHQNCIIHVLAPVGILPILSFMPEIDRSLIWPFCHGKLNICERYQFAKLLRSECYDQAIVLPNTFKSALIPFWAKIPLRTGWVGELRYRLLNDIRKLDKKQLPLMVQRFAALAFSKKETSLEKIPYPKLVLKNEFLLIVCQKFNLNINSKPILAICPGSEYGKAKKWPATYFAEVAKTKLENGWQVWLFGNKHDQYTTYEIQRLTQNQCVDFGGKTSLDEATALLSMTKMVVSNDTGLMHIAAALQLPLVVIYGSTSPNFTPPLSTKARIISLDVGCNPCFNRSCHLKEHQFKCLTSITPQMVLDVLDEQSVLSN